MELRILLACLAPSATAEFFYNSFNDSAGLRFNGAAGVSSCLRQSDYEYSVVYGINDKPDSGQQPVRLTETLTSLSEETFATITTDDTLRTARYLAQFPHRDAYAVAPDMSLCDVRLRLTPARPYHVGSVMRLETAPVLNGFETGFTFQITDHSQQCSQVKDRSFGIATHKSCSIAGGDGFAFVLHGDVAGASALGGGGGGLGYSGLLNALVVEFDTWYNADPAAGDLPYDHVAVHAALRPEDDPGDVGVSADVSCQIGQARRVDIADGLIHSARIVYWRHVKYDLLPFFTGTSALLPFLRDAGESRRMGTLAVYYDNSTHPVLALPLNLNPVLKLPENQAFMVRGVIADLAALRGGIMKA